MTLYSTWTYQAYSGKMSNITKRRVYALTQKTST
jgi:hypothetical protein